MKRGVDGRFIKASLLIIRCPHHNIVSDDNLSSVFGARPTCKIFRNESVTVIDHVLCERNDPHLNLTQTRHCRSGCQGRPTR